MNFDYVYKIIILGDSGVGKSNIVNQFVNGTFKDQNQTTIGIDFQIKQFNIDNDNIRIQIWDTAGQERFRCITRSYYQSVAGIILVFDLTRRSTFINITNWLSEIKKNIDNMAGIETILIGNKSDLENREVSEYDITRLQEEYDLPYIETSAKTYNNIDEMFRELVSRVHRHKKCIYSSKKINKDDDEILKLLETTKSNKSKCDCILL